MNVIEKLTAAGLNPKTRACGEGQRITVFASNASHPKTERVEIDVDAAGKVVRSSKYAYLLPESVGDDIRLA